MGGDPSEKPPVKKRAKTSAKDKKEALAVLE
jgi:hypothetical protein